MSKTDSTDTTVFRANGATNSSATFVVNAMNGTVRFGGQTHRLDAILKKVDKNKKLNRQEFEVLRKMYKVDPNAASASLSTCVTKVLDLGPYGRWV